MDGVDFALLERSEELAGLSSRLDSAIGGRGQSALVEGPAGIGKTSLLDACAGAATDRGMTVCRARGDELAMESSFAAVRELLWRETRAAGRDIWDGAAQLAAPVFGGGPDSGVDRDRVAAVSHGLYWLFANLAERAPLALLVDDAHLLDAASARFLSYFAHRVDSLPVLLAVAVRRGEAAGRALEAAFGEAAASVLRPGRLSEGASATLVRRVLGPRADEELCRSCHWATRGNPFFLRELTTALRAERGRPTVEAAAPVRGMAARGGAAGTRSGVVVRASDRRRGGGCGAAGIAPSGAAFPCGEAPGA